MWIRAIGTRHPVCAPAGIEPATRGLGTPRARRWNATGRLRAGSGAAATLTDPGQPDCPQPVHSSASATECGSALLNGADPLVRVQPEVAVGDHAVVRHDRLLQPSLKSSPPCNSVRTVILEGEPALRQRLEALPRDAQAELIHVLRLPDLDRAERIGAFWGQPETREFGELLIYLVVWGSP
jgi:hypothetical protein